MISHPFNELRLRRLIRERIRQETSKKFNWNEFLRLSDLDDIVEYASIRLKELGEGSSRIVFTLTSKSVLKIALSEKGIEQNQLEIKKFKQLKSLPAITKIFKSDEKYFHWIVAELVKPLSSDDEFEKITGVNLDDFATVHAKIRHENNNSFIEMLRELLSANVITNLRETLYYEQWGTNVDGELRLLDYGW